MSEQPPPTPATVPATVTRPKHVSTYMRRATPHGPATEIVRKLTVTRRVRAAINAMVWQGSKRSDAAAASGLTDHSLRAALRRPHVKAAYLAELAVLRNSERARNVHALVRVRDESNNAMARVSAARTLDDLAVAGEGEATGATRRIGPGITIIIGHDPQRSARGPSAARRVKPGSPDA